MALTTKEVQAQRALMSQEIKKLQSELNQKKKEYKDAFGSLPGVPSKLITIVIAIGLGLVGGFAMLAFVKSQYPQYFPF